MPRFELMASPVLVEPLNCIGNIWTLLDIEYQFENELIALALNAALNRLFALQAAVIVPSRQHYTIFRDVVSLDS